MRLAAAILTILLWTEAGRADHDRLEDAAWSGSVETVRTMLEAGIDPNPPVGHRGRVALVSAVEMGHADVVGLLLDYGADPERRDHRGDRALLVAARKVGLQAPDDYRQMMRRLIQAGARPDVRWDPFGTTPLMRAAAMGGDEASVRMLLAAGAEIDRATWSGHTALHSAADDPDGADMVHLLLGAGAAPRPRRDRDGATPLHLAAARGGAAAVEHLVEAGADIEAANRGGERALHLAARRGDLAIVDLLLGLGAWPDARDHAGHTPLVAAVVDGNHRRPPDAAVVARLAARSSDLDQALAAALWHDRVEVADMLRGHGARPVGLDPWGRSALAAAAALDEPSWFTLALAEGADLARDGGEALAWAARAGHGDRAAMLLRLGVAVDGRDGEGATAFVRAAASGHVTLAETLLRAGASPLARDHSGRGLIEHMAAVLAPVEAEIARAGQSAAWIDTSALVERRDRLKRAHAAVRQMVGIESLAGTRFAR